jgi:GST-like protein
MPATRPDRDRHPPDRYTLYGFKGSGSAADETARERLRAGSRERLLRHWEIFADVFPGQPFLSGATPGGLDFLAAVVAKWSGTRAHLRDARPQLLATLEAIERDPVVASVFERHWPAG